MRRRLTMCLAVGAAVLSGAAARPVGAQGTAPAGWKIKFDGSRSRPAIAEGVLYVGSADGAVYALDPKNGRTRWRFETGVGLPPGSSGPQIVTLPPGATMSDAIKLGLAAAEKTESGKRRVDATPVIDSGTVFVASEDLSLYAIDAASGTRKWSFKANERIFRTTVREGVAYVVTSAGLHALSAGTGERKWTFETLREIPTSQMNMGTKRPPQGPVMGEAVLCLTAWPALKDDTPRKSFVYALDPALGTQKWVTTLDGLDVSAPVVAKGLVLVSAERPHALTEPTETVTLYAIDAAEGNVRWKFDAPIAYTSEPISIGDGTVCFGTDKGVFGVDLATGQPKWSFVREEVTSVVTDGTSVYVVTHKGSFAQPNNKLYALGLSDGQERWSRSLKGNANIVGIDGGVVYTIGVPHLQAIDAGTGKVRWSFAGVDVDSSPLITGDTVFVPTAARDTWPASDPKPALFHGKQKVKHHDGYLYAVDAASGKAGP